MAQLIHYTVYKVDFVNYHMLSSYFLLFVFLILCSCLPVGSACDVQCLARTALIILKKPHDKSAGCADLVSGHQYLTGWT